MPHSLGPLRGPVRWISATPRRSATRGLGRATVGGVALAGLLGLTALTSLSALASPDGADVPAPPAAEAERLAFAERHRAVQHGGFVRAANTSLTCGTTPSCDSARDGRAGTNDDFAMKYVDIDGDPRTDNSSRAEVRLPTGARVTYARLYWGGNLLAGERKTAKDNARVLLAAPGGAYHEVHADTVVGHRTTPTADAFQASADVTRQTRTGGAGLYTVAQINAARGRAGGGAGAEGAGAGVARSGEARANGARAGEARADGARASEARANGARPGGAASHEAQPGGTQLDKAQPSKAQPDGARHGEAGSGEAPPDRAQPGGVGSGGTQPREARDGEAVSGQARSREARPDEAPSSRAQSSKAQPEGARPGQVGSPEGQPGEARSGRAQPDAARSGDARSGEAGADGAWAGWTLVVAYEHPAEPLRRLVLWDGFEALDRAGHEIRVTGLGAAPGAWGQAGLVAYNGDRGRGGDTLTVSADRRAPVPLGDASNPFDDVLNSTVTGAPGRREPAYEQTLGYDSDVFEIGSALRRGGDQLAFRLVSQPDAAWAGVLFVAVDVPK